MILSMYKEIGDTLKTLRKNKGITQKEMAELLNIPYSTYSNYENNNRFPNDNILSEISSILDINTEDLLEKVRLDKQEFNSIGKNIREIRESMGYSQEEFACLISEKLNEKVSRVSISRYENDERIPNYKILNTISKISNVGISIFFNESKELPNSNNLIELSKEELEILFIYRGLKEEEKAELLSIMRRLYSK